MSRLRMDFAFLIVIGLAVTVGREGYSVSGTDEPFFRLVTTPSRSYSNLRRAPSERFPLFIYCGLSNLLKYAGYGIPKAGNTLICFLRIRKSYFLIYILVALILLSRSRSAVNQVRLEVGAFFEAYANMATKGSLPSKDSGSACAASAEADTVLAGIL